MTALELKNFIRATLIKQRNITQEITAFDAVIDFIVSTISTGISEWDEDLIFNIDGTGNGAFTTHPDVDGKVRFWKTKVDDNIGNPPPTDPNVTENTFWVEISPGAGSAIQEWAPSIYGAGLVIVYFDVSGAGTDPALYVLTNPTRPFESTNFVTELAAGKWKKMSGSGGGGGNGLAIANTYDDITDLIADQDAQVAGAWYMVQDASDDTTVTADWAIYQYLGTTDEDLGDYLKIMERESLDVVINNASETAKGLVEEATTAEVTAGTDTGGSGAKLFVTPSKLNARITAWWNAIKAAAVVFTNTLTATQLTASGQNGTGYRMAILDSSGKVVRYTNCEIDFTNNKIIYHGADDLDSSYSFEIRNYSGQLIMRVSNGFKTEFGHNGVSSYEIPDDITSGNAQMLFNNNQSIAYRFRDKGLNDFVLIKSTTDDKSILVKQKLEHQLGGINFIETYLQAEVTTTNTNSAWYDLMSFTIPNNSAMSIHITQLFAYATDGSTSQLSLGTDALFLNTSGTITVLNPTSITMLGTSTSWRVTTDGKLQFQNSASGKIWTVMCTFRIIKRNLPTS